MSRGKVQRMIIQKGEMKYSIEEQERIWKVESVNGKLTVCYKLNKEDYPTIDDVCIFIMQSNMF
jgi:hypothetical protein